MSSSSTTKVISVGNPLCGDDGIGPAVIAALHNCPLPDSVSLLNAGIDPLNIVDELINNEKVILIDAAMMKGTPGDVHFLKPYDLKHLSYRSINSTHGFGVAECIDLAIKLGSVSDISLIGVQPENIDAGNQLSDSVSSSIPEIIEIILKEVNR